MVAAVSRDSFFPAPPALDDAEAAGFWIEAGRDARVSCRDVRGFAEALVAAADPIALAPTRLVIVAPEDDALAWIEQWSEDAEQVRRSLVIRRASDGAQIAIIATLASHGFGVPTSLAVESVRAREGGDILRSGVHLKVDVAAALARFAADLDGDAPND
jgi:hypothetical protein